MKKRGRFSVPVRIIYLTIPLSVFKKYYGERRSAGYTIMAPDKTQIAETMDEVIGALRKIRKFLPVRIMILK